MEINGISQFKTSEDGVSQDLVNFINSAEIPFIMSNIQERITPESAWGALQQHYEQLNRNGELQLNYLLRDDPHRAQVMSLAIVFGLFKKSPDDGDDRFTYFVGTRMWTSRKNSHYVCRRNN